MWYIVFNTSQISKVVVSRYSIQIEKKPVESNSTPKFLTNPLVEIVADPTVTEPQDTLFN